MTNQYSELASAITVALGAAQKAGLPLDIRIGVAAQLDTKEETMPVPLRSESQASRLAEIEEKLLQQLALAPFDALTLTNFAAAIGRNEDSARAAMRGAGRSTLSVKDDLYDRFDTPRSDGGKVRTYRLTEKGRQFVKAL